MKPIMTDHVHKTGSVMPLALAVTGAEGEEGIECVPYEHICRIPLTYELLLLKCVHSLSLYISTLYSAVYILV